MPHWGTSNEYPQHMSLWRNNMSLFGWKKSAYLEVWTFIWILTALFRIRYSTGWWLITDKTHIFKIQIWTFILPSLPVPPPPSTHTHTHLHHSNPHHNPPFPSPGPRRIMVKIYMLLHDCIQKVSASVTLILRLKYIFFKLCKFKVHCIMYWLWSI